jgi:hypothetical protein
LLLPDRPKRATDLEWAAAWAAVADVVAAEAVVADVAAVEVAVGGRNDE